MKGDKGNNSGVQVETVSKEMTENTERESSRETENSGVTNIFV